jgi:thioredoxin-dependent peroxiredoxin
MQARAVLRSGGLAPGFTLPGYEPATDTRRDVSLEEFRGQPVVLAFYPGDDTPVCTRQLSTYSGGIERFDEVGAQVLAISPQSIESHVRFSAHIGGFAFPLLSDEDKEVGRAYGILGPLGFYRRSVFVVDGDGVIRFAWRSAVSLRYARIDDVVEAVEAVVAGR